MIKLFCDLCQNQIDTNQTPEIGKLVRAKKIIPLTGGMPQNAGFRMVDEPMDLCETCQKKVWEFAENLKSKDE